MGVPGMPQSGSGQAALLTGLNVPALIGGHYGPWPSQPIVNLLNNGQHLSGRAAAGEDRRVSQRVPAVLLRGHRVTAAASIRPFRRAL